MKDTIYFQHDYDAYTDPKVIKLRVSKWWEWYWLFRACLEVMRSDADIVIKECEMDAIAFRLHYDSKWLADFLHFCAEIDLFTYDSKDKLFYSKRLQEDVEYMRLKSKKAKKSANARRKARSNANALQTQSEGNAIYIGYDSIGYDNNIDIDNSIKNEIKSFWFPKEWEDATKYKILVELIAMGLKVEKNEKAILSRLADIEKKLDANWFYVVDYIWWKTYDYQKGWNVATNLRERQYNQWKPSGNVLNSYWKFLSNNKKK